MKKLTFFFLLSSFLIPIGLFGQNIRSFNNKTYRLEKGIWRDSTGFQVNDTVVTVKLRSLTTKNEVIERQGKVLRRNTLGYLDIRVPKGTDPFSFAEKLKKLPEIESVEVNTFGRYTDKVKDENSDVWLVPNDPQRSNQWYLNNIGAYQAWDITTGSNCISVAIIDSGTDWTHSDIGTGADSYQNIALNDGEDVWSDVSNPTTGNHIDDDGNGLVDDWKGWNYYASSNNARSSNPHGTNVSGIVSAKTNNNVGILPVTRMSYQLVLPPLADYEPISRIMEIIW